MRDLNNEFVDTKDRKYAYDFDYRMHDYLMRTFEPYIGSKSSALEMGCYRGEFTKRLANRFDSVTVLEGSEELINEARRNVDRENVDFVHARFEDASLKGRYDAIFLIHTLEHLDNPNEILTGIKDWLSPDGQLFLVVPNARALSRQIAVKMGLIDFNAAVTDGEYKHGHRKTYSMDTLHDEVRKASLLCDSSGGVFVKPLANYQFDLLSGGDVVSEEYMEGCYQLSTTYPDLCSSIYIVCSIKR